MKGSPKPWEWGGRGEKSKTGRETQRLGEALGLGVGKRAGLLSKPSGRRCWWDGGTPQPGGAPGAASVPCPPRASLGGGAGVIGMHAEGFTDPVPHFGVLPQKSHKPATAF